MGSANTLTEDPDIRTQNFKSVLSGYPYHPNTRIIRISELSALSRYPNLKTRIRWIRITRISGYSHYPNPNFSTNCNREVGRGIFPREPTDFFCDILFDFILGHAPGSLAVRYLNSV